MAGRDISVDGVAAGMRFVVVGGEGVGKDRGDTLACRGGDRLVCPEGDRLVCGSGDTLENHPPTPSGMRFRVTS